MPDSQNSPTAQIQAIFTDTTSQGWKPETSRGASDEQIWEFTRSQGAPAIPEALREVYRLIGAAPGLWFSGSTFGVIDTGPQLKEEAADLLKDTAIDVREALVLTGHGGYEYQFIPAPLINLEAPPVWMAREADDEDEGDEPVVTETWPSVVEWFRSASNNVLRWRETLAARPGSGEELVRKYFSH